MRKHLVLAAALIIGTSAVAAEKEINIGVQDVDPVPAEPGDTVEIYISVSNDGSTEAVIDPLEVETVEGMEFIGTTSNFRNSFNLCGGCQKVGDLYLKVSEDTESGSYPVDITAKSGDVGAVEKTNLRVDGKPELVFNAKTGDIVPGKSFEMNLSIQNAGTDVASGVIVRPSREGFSFSPSEISVGNIPPGETKSIILDGEVDRNVDAGIQTIPMDVSFRDDSTDKTKSAKLPVKVLESAELAIADFDTAETVRGQKTTVTLEIENLGPGEAERIVSWLECEGADVGSGKSFVGKLGKDESVPVTFEVTPTQEDVSCSVKTSYTDNTRVNIEESFNFQSTSSNSPLPIVIGVLIVLGIAGVYWRKRRKNELEEI